MGGQYGDSETMWDVTEDMAQLDQEKITHYESFGRQRMKIKRKNRVGLHREPDRFSSQ